MAENHRKKDGKKQKKNAGKGARSKRSTGGRGVFAVADDVRPESVEELRARARRLGLTGYYRLRKADLLERIQEGETLTRV
ncbi:Rho termination factor N-terminal domain-containing protein [Microbacteriaceae bacterium 4G12]